MFEYVSVILHAQRKIIMPEYKQEANVDLRFSLIFLIKWVNYVLRLNSLDINCYVDACH